MYNNEAPAGTHHNETYLMSHFSYRHFNDTLTHSFNSSILEPHSSGTLTAHYNHNCLRLINEFSPLLATTSSSTIIIPGQTKLKLISLSLSQA